MSSSDTYFVATTTVTSPPTSARTRSYAARTASGDTRHHSLPSRRAAVAAVREEELRVAGRAQVDALDLLDAGRAQRPLGRGPQVELAARDDVAAERLPERPGDLLPHLVAARADARADARGERAAAEGLGGGRRDPGEQPAPPRVDDGDRRVAVRARERD